MTSLHLFTAFALMSTAAPSTPIAKANGAVAEATGTVAEATGTVAIVDTLVLTGDGGRREHVTVVIDDGRIVAIDENRPAPKDATVIDGRGRILTPGFIECATELGLVEIDGEPTANDAAVAHPFVPAARAFDAFRRDSTRLPLVRAAGVTHLVVRPTGGILPGQASLVSLDDDAGTAPFPLVGLSMEVDENRVALTGRSRVELWLKLREITDDARHYQKQKANYERGASRPLSLLPMHLESFALVERGDVPLFVTADAENDIRSVLAFVDEENKRGSKFRIVLVGAREAWRIADELARRKIPVIVTPSEQLPERIDALHARDDNPALLQRAGVTVVFSTRTWANNVSRLRQEAGIAVAHGFPREHAVTALTANAANAIGHEKDLGVIAVGRPAHVVLWSGDPFELSSRAEAVFIDGKSVSLDTRHRALAEKYLQQKRDEP